MGESLGGCGNSDEFGDVCGSSDYRSGELAINLCDQCIIANLRSNLKAALAEVGRLQGKVTRQRERITYLEGATNHATGTPLSKALHRLAERG